MVGMAGFEPATFCPPDRRANQIALHPDVVFCTLHYSIYAVHSTVSTSVGVSRTEVGRPRRFIGYSLRVASNLRNAESVICSRNGGTRTHDLLRVKELFLPLNYIPKTEASLASVGVEGFEPPTTCTQSTRTTGLCYTPSVCLLPGVSTGLPLSTPMGARQTKRQHARGKGREAADASAPLFTPTC